MSRAISPLGTWAPPIGRPVVNLAHLAYFDRGARGSRAHCLILAMVGGDEVVLDHPSAEAQELTERSLRACLSSAAVSEEMDRHIQRLPKYPRSAAPPPPPSSTRKTR